MLLKEDRETERESDTERERESERQRQRCTRGGKIQHLLPTVGSFTRDGGVIENGRAGGLVVRAATERGRERERPGSERDAATERAGRGG